MIEITPQLRFIFTAPELIFAKALVGYHVIARRFCNWIDFLGMVFLFRIQQSKSGKGRGYMAYLSLPDSGVFVFTIFFMVQRAQLKWTPAMIRLRVCDEIRYP